MYRYEKKESKFKYIMYTVLLMIVASVSTIFLYKMYLNINVENGQNPNVSNNTAVRLATNQEEKTEDITDTIEKVTKCVVGISKIKNKGDNILETNATEDLKLGTGVIISENGHIITNWHLAGNKYSSCYVTMEDGTVYNGNIVWADSDLDLAIVKISANNLKYLQLGDSDNIKIGETVYAIGNPIGIEFQRTVTKGIVSGLNRTIKIEEDKNSSYMEGLIQTDASINQGNSGGPLINTKGEVVGINSVKIETAEGIGFAIPVNIFKPVVESLVNEGEFEEAYLGIFAYDKEVIKYLNNDVSFNEGIYVVKIAKDGPAEETNLKTGDVITKIDGNSINRMTELRTYIYRKKPGEKATLTVNRNNKEIQIEVMLSKK